MSSGIAGRGSSITSTRAQSVLTRRYVPGLNERRLLLFVVDQIAVFAAFFASGEFHALRVDDLAHAILAVAVVGAWWVSASAFDAYDVRRASSLGGSVASVSGAFGLAFLVLLLIGGATGVFSTPLAPALVFGLFALLLLSTGRWGYVHFLTRASARRAVVLVGWEPEAARALRLLEREAATEYRVLGVLEPGSPDQALVATADEVINVAFENDAQATDYVASLRRARPEIGLRNFAAVYEQLLGRVPIQYVCPHWRVLVEARTGRYVSVFVKRAMDIVLSMTALVLLSPLFVIIAAAIRLDSRGPVIYRQQREGLHGRTFTMLKFRTMVDGAEAGDAIWERHEDPRRTRVGKILRPLHLDEAPQLLNVLSGTMSLVGPRPERSQFVRQLEKVAPAYRDRMLVRPGITGWAQVRFGYARSLEESIEKLEHDLYYVKHWSPFLDLVIGLKTFSALLARTGNDAPSEGIMLVSRPTAPVETETAASPVSVASS
jgi:exopolysaccharide biosynthesis polyprenyl glycosylphosphotransferase